MHVACTFKDVEDIIHAYKAAGIEKVEFCLVGWNIKGHDGRWPQILPVEESLGGEEGLRSLIKTANDAGYRVVCHTNSTDAYSIADNFDLYNIARTRNGNVSIETTYWAGGRPAVYYYSKFVSNGKDWMGDTDFTVASPEKIQRDTNALKMQMDQYNELQYLQYEFMENHEKIADNVYQITYSDGSVVMVDYNEMKYTLKKA